MGMLQCQKVGVQSKRQEEDPSLSDALRSSKQPSKRTWLKPLQSPAPPHSLQPFHCFLQEIQRCHQQ